MIITVIVHVVLDQVGWCAQRVEAVVGDLEHEASIDEAVGRPQLPVRS